MPHLASSVARIKASKCHIGLSTNAEVCEPSDSGLPGANVPNRELKNSRGAIPSGPWLRRTSEVRGPCSPRQNDVQLLKSVCCDYYLDAADLMSVSPPSNFMNPVCACAGRRAIQSAMIANPSTKINVP
jgi:hypothetical protein